VNISVITKRYGGSIALLFFAIKKRPVGRLIVFKFPSQNLNVVWTSAPNVSSESLA